MSTQTRLQMILAFLRDQNHHFVSFTFTKKNGDVRRLVARIELAEQLNARYPFNPAAKGLLPVRDLALWKRTRDPKKSSRFINCAGPVTVRAGGREITF